MPGIPRRCSQRAQALVVRAWRSTEEMFTKKHQWVGSYSYSWTESEVKPVTFELNLKVRNNLTFKGTARDEMPTATPEVAEIKGKIVGNRIKMRKFYPNLPMRLMDSNGNLTDLREMVEKRMNREVDGVFMHPCIYYFGSLESESVYTGSWYMLSNLIPLVDGDAIKYPKSQGTFRIETK